jgi:hypothetical protein
MLTILFSCLIALATAQNTFLSPQPASSLNSSYLALVSNHSRSFHPSANSGARGLTLRAQLTSAAISFTSSGSPTLVGRDLFDQATPVDTRLFDQVYVQEGNVVASLFVTDMQGSGTRFAVETAEFMVFDEQALLYSLVNILPTGVAMLQASGEAPVPSTAGLSLMQISNAIPKAFTTKARTAASQLNRNFNAGKPRSNLALAAQDVIVHANGNTTTGQPAFLDLFTRYTTSIPDLIAHDEYLVAQGNFAAVGFLSFGVRNGTFTAVNGTRVPPSNGFVSTRGARFMRFNVTSGLIQEIWEVADNDAFLAAVA